MKTKEELALEAAYDVAELILRRLKDGGTRLAEPAQQQLAQLAAHRLSGALCKNRAVGKVRDQVRRAWRAVHQTARPKEEPAATIPLHPPRGMHDRRDPDPLDADLEFQIAEAQEHPDFGGLVE